MQYESADRGQSARVGRAEGVVESEGPAFGTLASRDVGPGVEGVSS